VVVLVPLLPAVGRALERFIDERELHDRQLPATVARAVCPGDRSARAAEVALVAAVLLVGDVIEPGHDLTVLVGLLDRDVRHEACGGRAVPVLLARLDVDDVAGADLLRLAAAAGDVPHAVGDVERLSLGVVVPCGAGAGGEADVGATDRGLVVGVADAVDVDGSCR
jgi:hypothetical protein